MWCVVQMSRREGGWWRRGRDECEGASCGGCRGRGGGDGARGESDITLYRESSSSNVTGNGPDCHTWITRNSSLRSGASLLLSRAG